MVPLFCNGYWLKKKITFGEPGSNFRQNSVSFFHHQQSSDLQPKGTTNHSQSDVSQVVGLKILFQELVECNGNLDDHYYR